MSRTSNQSKRIRINFSETNTDVEIENTNGSTEFCTDDAVNQVEPSAMQDPLGTADAGAYPQAPALALLYVEYKPHSCWVRVQAFSSDIGNIEFFSYWSNTTTVRHVGTEEKGNLRNIPRIQFRKFPPQLGGSTSGRSVTVFRRIKYNDMYPTFSQNPAGTSALISSKPANGMFFHYGMIRVDGVVLETKNCAFQIAVGMNATVFRRLEISNPG